MHASPIKELINIEIFINTNNFYKISNNISQNNNILKSILY
jgi:hypothetical protein